MFRKATRLTALLFSLTSFTAPAWALNIVETADASLKIGDFESFQRMTVTVDEQLKLKPKGFLGLGVMWVVEPRAYTDLTRATIDGRDYALLPIDVYDTGRLERWDGVAVCKAEAFGYVAVDVETGDLLNRGVYLFPCATNTWVLYQTLDPKKSSGQVSVTSFRSPEEAAADNARTLGDKKQIGTLICLLKDGKRFVGYTEAVSPDNGRIQVRVSKAYDAKGYWIRDYVPNIVWDNPDNWQLCEAP